MRTRSSRLVASATLFLASHASAQIVNVAVPPPPPPPPGVSSAAPTDPSTSSTAPTLEPVAITAQPADAPVTDPNVIVPPGEPERVPPPPAPTEPRRLFGIGTVLGGGFSGGVIAGSSSATYVGGALVLPTVESRAFTRRGLSFDISLPVGNMVLSSILVRGIAWSTDVFLNLNLGSGRFRLLFGPGLGVSFLAASSGGSSVSSAAIRLPGELGVEILLDSRAFGFHLITRPWVEVARTTASSSSWVTTFGGGMLFLVGFFGYGLAR